MRVRLLWAVKRPPLMKALYGIYMEQSQYPKLLSDIPPVDIVVTMGCNVQCPMLPCKYRYDWGLDDPTGKSDEEVRKIIRQIILDLKFLFQNTNQ